MSESKINLRIIKKYVNRRLYDTHESRYTTLEEIEQLVINGIPFKVIDTSGEEITNNVLMQIIILKESGENANKLFDQDALKNIIILYQNMVKGVTQNFFAKLVEGFAQQQNSWVKQQAFDMNIPPKSNSDQPFEIMQEMAQQSVDAWRKYMDQFNDFMANKKD